MAKINTRPSTDAFEGGDINFKRPSQAKEIIRRLKKNRGAIVGLILLILIILVVIFADVIAPYDAGVIQVANNKLAAPGTPGHPLGCDSFGRDVLSRLVHGARNSLKVAIIASITSCLVGCTLGSIAGYFGGKVDQIIMRALDIFMSIPDLLFTMVVVAALGSSIPVLIIAMTLAYFTNYVRLVRSGVLNLVDQEYVEAARAGGASPARIMIMITHDLGIVAQTCDNVAVMYAGEIIEMGSAEDIFTRPIHHPYTDGLFGSLPNLKEKTDRLHPIAGLMPDPTNLPKGCKFAPRCDKCMEICKEVPPEVYVDGTHSIRCHLYCQKKED